MALPAVKALLFDVFGTVVDWRSTVTNTLHARCQKTMYLADECSVPISVREKADSMTLEDWGRFAEQWRQAYCQYTREIAAAVEAGKGVGKGMDEFFLDSLKGLLEGWGLKGLWDEGTVLGISRVWRRLDPWEDSVEGIRKLNAASFRTCTLSNGSVELLSDMAEYAGLDWSHVFSAELFGSYKPAPAVYLGAAERLGLKPEQCAMVATHLGDLEAARKCGLRTVYVRRKQEEAWPEGKVKEARAWVDVWVEENGGGFLEVERKMRHE